VSLLGGNGAPGEDAVSKIREMEDREFCDRYEIERVDCGLAEYGGEDRKGDQFIAYLENEMARQIDFSENCHIFFPMALGGHVNHIQVFEACCLMMENYPQSDFILYEDLPYGHRMVDRFRRLGELADFIDGHGFRNYLRPLTAEEIARKREDVMIYRSQHVYREPSRVRIDRYFTRASLCRRPWEGIWLREGSDLTSIGNLRKNSDYRESLLWKFLQMFFI
jgi:LmbE family N-acetylglucosaminyl deacetylase